MTQSWKSYLLSALGRTLILICYILSENYDQQHLYTLPFAPLIMKFRISAPLIAANFMAVRGKDF